MRSDCYLEPESTKISLFHVSGVMSHTLVICEDTSDAASYKKSLESCLTAARSEDVAVETDAEIVSGNSYKPSSLTD